MSRRSEVQKLYQRGQRLINEGKYQDACQMMKEANEKGQFLAKNDLLRADISHYLGFILYKLNENAEAEIHFRIALGIKEMVMQPNDNSTAISLYMLGLTLQLQGKLEEAERVGERTINMLKVSPNKNDKHYARALTNLAGTLRQRGKLEASETMLRESLEITRRTFGKNHEETANTLNNLAVTLRSLKKFESAEAVFKESLEINERVYGRNHKKTSITLSNLADTLRQRGKFEASETMLRESLEIQRRTFGKNHEQTAITLHNLGACLMDQGNFSEAIEMLREVMSIHDSLKTSPEFRARTLKRLLESLNGDGKFERAEQEYLTFLEKYNDVPPDSIDWKEVIKQMERSLCEQGKPRELDELKQSGQYTVQSSIPTSNVSGYSLEAASVTPARDPTHTTDAAQTMSQPLLLQSPVQVEADWDVATETEKMLTADQEIEIAERICGDWEKFVVYLDPKFFRPNKIKEIKKTQQDNLFMQAQSALAMWTDHYHEKATQYMIIKTLCRIGYRAQAVEVFKGALVDFVAPP